MKAKILIKLLEKHPEAEVVFKEYNGCCEPLAKIQKIKFYEKNKLVDDLYEYDHGDCVDNNNIAKKDLILLKSH